METVTVSYETAITIKTMLAMALASCPESMYKDFAKAREEFMRSMSEAADDSRA